MGKIKCVKCGRKLIEEQHSCSYCEYKNNLVSGYIDEHEVISKSGEKPVRDYKNIVKKTFVIIISTAMVGVATAGGAFLLSAENEIKVSLGLMSSAGTDYKKEVKELLRGAKLGMSRDEIIAVENKYKDSMKELNGEDYVSYTGCNYGGFEGRTTYKFSGNNLSEISVVFYPQEDPNSAYESLIGSFTKEYGEQLKPEGEEAVPEEAQWNNGKLLIKLQNAEYIRLTVVSARK